MAAPVLSHPQAGSDRLLSGDAASTSSTSAHKMRIASGGSIKHYVNFALTFLAVSHILSIISVNPVAFVSQLILARQEHPGRPLILHTLPPPQPPTPSSSTSTSTLHPSTLTAPRLISVVELIKRSYISQLRDKKSGGKGKHGAAGLWQYTESGLVGESEIRDEGDDLQRAISGKNK